MDRKLLTLALVVTLAAFAQSCGSEETPEPPPAPDPVPGQQIPGQQVPGQQIPGQQVPGQQIPGQQVPGQQVPGQQVPGQQFPGQQVPGQQFPGQQMPGQQMPGQQMPGQQMPMGQPVAVTLTANSNPPGATVLLVNGTVVGTTPLVSQIQVPSDQLGLPQTFTFNLAGYNPTTATAVAVNNSITVQATLQPSGGMPGMMPGGFPTGMPRNISVRGGGGGPIYDYHTTTASANVNEPCVIQAMSVTVNGSHTFMSDLTVRLSGPNGQSATLQSRNRSNVFRTYSINRAVGTQAMGTWRLSIRDDVGADSGVLSGFSMNITCQ